MMSHTFDQSEAEDVMVVNQARRRKEVLTLRCGVKLPVALIKVLFDTNVMECWCCSSAPLLLDRWFLCSWQPSSHPLFIR